MEKKANKKNKLVPFILSGFVVVAGIFGVIKYQHSMTHEETDDAQIETDMSPIAAKVSGFITKINVEDNQVVEAGTVLVKLDDRDLKVKLEQAQAALENARANVAAMKSMASSVKTNVDYVEANIAASKAKLWQANQEFTRYNNLLKDGSGTKQQFDLAKSNKEAAEAQYQAVLKQKNSATANSLASDSQVAVAESVVKQRQAEVDFAKLQLSYTIIKAPYKGIIAKKSIQQGQLVQIGQALFSLVKSNRIWVVGNFKETQVERMRVGQRVEVEVDAFPGKIFESKIASLSPATGAKFSLLPPDNSSGNFVKVVQRIPVKIEFDTKDVSQLRAGMNVKATVILE